MTCSVEERLHQALVDHRSDVRKTLELHRVDVRDQLHEFGDLLTRQAVTTAQLAAEHSRSAGHDAGDKAGRRWSATTVLLAAVVSGTFGVLSAMVPKCASTPAAHAAPGQPEQHR
jgi:hypothetical protein